MWKEAQEVRAGRKSGDRRKSSILTYAGGRIPESLEKLECKAMSGGSVKAQPRYAVENLRELKA